MSTGPTLHDLFTSFPMITDLTHLCLTLFSGGGGEGGALGFTYDA